MKARIPNAAAGGNMMKRLQEMQANMEQNVEKAYLHAVSVMKSQVYTPEGVFRHLWTTPDRYPHKKLCKYLTEQKNSKGQES